MLNRLAAMAAAHKARGGISKGHHVNHSVTLSAPATAPVYRSVKPGEYKALYARFQETNETLWKIGKAAGINPKNFYNWARTHKLRTTPRPDDPATITVLFID